MDRLYLELDIVLTETTRIHRNGGVDMYYDVGPGVASFAKIGSTMTLECPEGTKRYTVVGKDVMAGRVYVVPYHGRAG